MSRVAAWRRALAACLHRVAAWIHTAAASVSYGCSLHCIWLQARRSLVGSCATSRAATGDTRPTYYGSAAPQGSPSTSTKPALLISTYYSLLTHSRITTHTHHSLLTTHHYSLTTHYRTTYYYDVLLRRTTEQAREAPRPEPPAADRFRGRHAFQGRWHRRAAGPHDALVLYTICYS